MLDASPYLFSYYRSITGFVVQKGVYFYKNAQDGFSRVWLRKKKFPSGQQVC